MFDRNTTLSRWLHGVDHIMSVLVVPYERLISSCWGRGFHYVLLALAIFCVGFCIVFPMYEAHNLLVYPSNWSKYPQGYAGLWEYQSLGHYVVSCFYIAVVSASILGAILYWRTTWAIAMGLVVPPLLIRLTPDVVYEVLYVLFSPLLSGGWV